MKTFVKWTKRAAIMLIGLVLILYITGQVKVGLGKIVLILVIGSSAFGLFFYLIEDKYFPIRKKHMLRKVKKIFNAKELSESRAQFSIEGVDVIVDIAFTLSLNKYAAQGEVISFHIPRKDLGSVHLTTPLSQIEESIDGIQTYRIYQTNGMGLKLAKRRIEKRLKNKTDNKVYSA